MSATLTLWNKHMTKLFVHKEEAIGTLFQPILWVVLFGSGMKSIIGSIMPGGEDVYITFMVPGIIALTAMSGSIAGGLVLVQERLLGIVKEYYVAPISRMSVLMGNALSTVTKSLFQAIVILIIGVLMGALINLEPQGLFGGLIFICGFGLGFAGIGLAVASKASSAGGYHMLIFMFTLPTLFVSNALYPLASLPTWMRFCARANPMSYAVDGLRHTLFQGSANMAGSELIPLWLCFVVVLAFGIFGMLLAYVAFRRSTK
ncbi:ABC transporter permease [Chloroflexota bacterium]